jgi:F0F1-type ATP synthase delta subunit
MVSRVQVAAFVAERLASERPKMLRDAAAWLIETGRIRQARYLARDVAAILADRGYVLVRVTSARPLEGEARASIERFVREQTGARELELETAVDETLIGGVKIETPLAALDDTVRTKLVRYAEGVMS